MDELDLMQDEIPPDEEEGKRGAWIYFAAIFMILILTFWILANYVAPLDPSPKNIPSLEDARRMLSSNQNLGPRGDVYAALNATNVKPIADYIATSSCTESRICFAKAIYLFVRDRIKYISDPVSGDYIQVPASTLETGGGDCEDGAVLLVSMLRAIGVRAEFVFQPEHVLLRAWMPDAAKHYKSNGDWVYMDWTCNTCEFGEVPIGQK